MRRTDDNMNFIRNNGEVVTVNDNDVTTLEKNQNYTLYGAKHNPSGEQMVLVNYNEANMDNDIGGDVRDSYEEIEAEQAKQNPGKTTAIRWQNLRLQSAIDGELVVSGVSKKARKGAQRAGRGFFSAIAGGAVAKNDSIRDDPLLIMATAKHWYSYIQNMNTVDIGAEFAAGVSHAQRASTALFAHEWQNDPGHDNLMRRLLPGADVQDAIAKGQIAYDVLTRGRDILSQAGYGGNQSEIMHKLVYDVLRSMPIETYNFYTLYQLHVHEGDRIYSEFQSRYVPLDVAEVEMVLEMQRALDVEGDAYAFRTTNNEQQAVLASKVMRSAVAAYEVGDTVTTRTAIHALQQPPYNFRPRAMPMAAAGGTGVETYYLEFELGGQKGEATKKIDQLQKEGVATKTSGNKMGAWVLGIKDTDLDDNNKHKLHKNAGKDTVQIAHSQFDLTPAYLAVKLGGKDGKGKWKLIDYTEDYLKSDNKKAKQIKQGLGKGGGKGGSGGGGTKGRKEWTKKKEWKKNPAGVGRGKLHHIEIWPKSQLNMKRREPAEGKQRGETRHGTGKSKGQGYWTRNVYKHLPEYQMLQMGTLKKTGEEAPFRIRLPTSHFAIRTHPATGYKTVMPKKNKANKEFLKAYEDFLTFYGIPKHAPSKDTHNRFIIPKSERVQSDYFKEVRSKSGQ